MARLPDDTLKQDFNQYQLPEPSPDATLPIVPSANGAVLANGDFSSPNYVPGISGWKLDAQGNFEGVSGTFSGTVSVSSLNIPNTTTSNSFHTDSNGNSWWGASVASGFANANAYILNTGAAVFKNVQIGGTTIQYVITNSGIFSYGDGSDGTATCDGSTAVSGMSRVGNDYTMTRDCYFTTLTINNSVTLNPNGYRLFVSNTLTIGTGASGKIFRNGNAGSVGGTGTQAAASGGGSGASVLSDGYLKGSVAGGTGFGSGGAAAYAANGSGGGTGTNTSNSLGTNGVQGGTGGDGLDSVGSTHTGGGPSAAGVATVSNVKLIANWHLATLLDIILIDGTPTGYKTGQTIRFDNSAAASGGGCGGAGQPQNGSSNSSGGAGGGAGGVGGVIAIYARNIVIRAGALITSNGGAGGVGGNGANATDALGGGSGGGGGGGGGNGGIIVLVYNSLTNSGSITTSAGAGGTGGTGGTATLSGRPGTNGTSGTNGSAGTIYQFQLSL